MTFHESQCRSSHQSSLSCVRSHWQLSPLLLPHVASSIPPNYAAWRRCRCAKGLHRRQVYTQGSVGPQARTASRSALWLRTNASPQQMAVAGSNTLLVVYSLAARRWPWPTKLDSLRKRHYYEADQLLMLEQSLLGLYIPHVASSIPLHMCCFFDWWIHTYIHTQRSPAPMYIHAYTHTYIYAYIHTCMHSYIHVYIHTYLHI